MKYITLPVDLKDLAMSLAYITNNHEIRTFVNYLCEYCEEWDINYAILADRLRVLQGEATEDDPVPSNEDILKYFPAIN